jgi:hypothetical protein
MAICEQAVVVKQEVLSRNLSRETEEIHKIHAEMLLAWLRIHPGPPKYEEVVFTSPMPNSV